MPPEGAGSMTSIIPRAIVSLVSGLIRMKLPVSRQPKDSGSNQIGKCTLAITAREPFGCASVRRASDVHGADWMRGSRSRLSSRSAALED